MANDAFTDLIALFYAFFLLIFPPILRGPPAPLGGPLGGRGPHFEDHWPSLLATVSVRTCVCSDCSQDALARLQLRADLSANTSGVSTLMLFYRLHMSLSMQQIKWLAVQNVPVCGLDPLTLCLPAELLFVG